MKRFATFAALAVVLVPVGSAADHTVAGHAKLRFLSMAPLKVKGTGFVPGERIVVGAKGTAGVSRKRTFAGGTGSWVLSLSRPADRCNAVVVTAVGSRGSRASLKQPQPLCPPPL